MSLLDQVSAAIEKARADNLSPQEVARAAIAAMQDATLTKCARDSHGMDFYQPGQELMGVWQRTIEDALDA